MLAKQTDRRRPAATRPLGLAPSLTRIRPAPPRTSVRSLAEGCLAELPDDYRAVLWLMDVERLSRPDVARRLNVSEDIVDARVHRARVMVARALCRRCLPVAVTR